MLSCKVPQNINYSSQYFYNISIIQKPYRLLSNADRHRGLRKRTFRVQRRQRFCTISIGQTHAPGPDQQDRKIQNEKKSRADQSEVVTVPPVSFE